MQQCGEARRRDGDERPDERQVDAAESDDGGCKLTVSRDLSSFSLYFFPPHASVRVLHPFSSLPTSLDKLTGVERVMFVFDLGCVADTDGMVMVEIAARGDVPRDEAENVDALK